ncbi:MAG: hypothetical protein ABIA74_05855 [bacterium]
MGFKKISSLLIFSLLFCNLSSKGPLDVLRFFKSKLVNTKGSPNSLVLVNIERKFVFMEEQYFNFLQKRNKFFKCIEQCCCDENFKEDVRNFYEQEINFFEDLSNEIPIVNSKINTVTDLNKLNELNAYVNGLNTGFEIFFNEKKVRYEELNDLVIQYFKEQSDLLHALILTKYELLREKQVSMIAIWNYFYQFFELFGFMLCIVYNKNHLSKLMKI